MAAEDQRRLAVEGSQNIALLSLLTRNPTSLHINECPPRICKHDGKRVLSLRRESHLAEALAFICGVSNNRDHVTAVSVEELSGGSVLRVLVAVNRSTHANPSDERLLRQIKNGLEPIFHLLARASSDPDPGLEEKILDAVIDLCRTRILLRNRSQRDDVERSRPGKQFAGSGLERVLRAVRQHSYEGLSMQVDVKLFVSQVERLLRAMNDAETSERGETNLCLKRLVTTACALHRGRKAVKLEKVLDRLSNKELNPSDATWFKAWVKKLARYRECAGYLFRTAKRHSLFLNATVIPVSLGAECFLPLGGSPGPSCLDSCISRCRNEAGSSDRSMLKRRVAAMRDIGSRGNDGFLQRFQLILNESRIHAEVQIVAYYELHQAATPPRVIKSSKSACYLCHLFIKEHGKFHTPATHGRMYNGWRLPTLDRFNQVQIKLNKSLQSRIWGAALEYTTIGKAQVLISVNESDVGTLSPMSSLASFGLLTGTTSKSKPLPGGNAQTTREARSPREVVPGMPERLSTKIEVEEGPHDVAPVSTPESTQEEQFLSAALSSTDKSSVVDQVGPIPGLKAIQEVEDDSSKAGSSSQKTTDEVIPSSRTTVAGIDDIESPTRHPPSEIVTAQMRGATQEAPKEEAKEEPKEQSREETKDELPTETPPRHVEPVTESAYPLSEDISSLEDDDFFLSEPGLNLPGSSQIKLPSQTSSEAESEQDEEEDDIEIELVPDQAYTFRPDSRGVSTAASKDRKVFPSYHTAKAGGIVIYPEFETGISTSSSLPSSVKDVVELRVTRLLALQPPGQGEMRASPSGKSGCRQGHGLEDIPEYHVDSLPLSKDVITAGRVRLVDSNGDVLLVEVVRG